MVTSEVAPKSRGEKVVDSIHVALDDSTVVHFVGRKYLAQNKQLRAIIWVPVTSPIEASKLVGGQLVDDATARQHHVLTRVETYEVHVLAEDAEQTDALLDSLLAAGKTALGSTFRAGSYRWLSDEEAFAGWSVRQPRIVVQLSFELPVPKKKQKLYTITAQTHECSLLQPLAEFELP